MPFNFHPKHEYNCPNVSHCPHLGGAALRPLVVLRTITYGHRSHTVIAVIRSSQSCGGHSSGAIDVSLRHRETSRSPPERLLSGTPVNNDNPKEQVCRRHRNPRPLLKLERRDMTYGRGTKLLRSPCLNAPFV